MKTLISLTFIFLSVSLTAMAEDTMPMHDSMQSGMKNQHMMQMHEHMQKMQALMKDIHQEKDPGQFQNMMKQHMGMMQESMHMMNGHMGMCKDMGMKHGMGNMSGSDSMPMCEDECRDMSGGHMNMMHQMMQQMMDHMQMMQNH